MDSIQIKEAIEARARALEVSIAAYRDEMNAQVEELKNNEIINAINAINRRLTDIEDKINEFFADKEEGE